ncbi:MAG: sterol desaturase family protein [Flavobacteriaceae bacterium]
MEAYAQALLIAIPGFLLLILIEILYGFWRKNQTYSFMDTLASLSSGVTNILKDSLGLAVILISYPWLVDTISLHTIESNWQLYFVAFICIDFAAYWGHRLNHHVNLFWNQHVIHHSSEEFNLACALRQSISNIVGYNALFLIPAALVGVPSEVINVLAPIHLFGQFWYHTRHIGKLGWLEYLLVTPSQHRVHHAINPIYLDKNLAAIFCVWDRLFGTFQEELETEPPVYGTLKPTQTWNPFFINFQHFWGLLTDAWHTQSWKDKFRIWFMPTGWRPSDVMDRFPRVLTDYKKQVKYHTPSNRFMKIWALFQLLGTTFLLLNIFAIFGTLSYTQLCLWGFLLFTSVFSYTAIMDGQRYGTYLLLFYPLTGLVYLLGFTANLYEVQPVFFYGAFIFLSLTWLSGLLIPSQVNLHTVDESTA